jgi:hypothetical protein
MSDLRDRELARLRAMTPADKLRVADRLRADAFRIARAAVAQRNPAWNKQQVEAAARRLVTGA